MLAFANALGDGTPIVGLAISKRLTQGGSRLVRIAKLGRHGVDRVHIDTARQDPTIAVQNLSPLCR